MAFEKAIKDSDVHEGKVHKAKIGKKEFALVRLQDGVYCIDGICTHEGGPLGEGTMSDGWLVCPWHEGHFNPKTGETDPETDWVTPVKAHRTKVEGGYIWIEV